jgi:hypothetical protein
MEAKMTTIGRVLSRSVLAGTFGAMVFTSAVGAEDVLTYDPAKVIEDEQAQCAQCHENAVNSWMESTHKKTYDELHLRDEAKAVIERLGMSGSIRRNDECVQCHYTQAAKEAGGRASTVMGVSCQRCHGPAKEWMDIHQNTDGIPDRKERLSKSEAAGMRLTDDIYTLAMNCFQCHTVPKEDLVNKGQHPAGSDFELVAWSHGEVRHNFLNDDPAKRKEQPENQDSSKETKALFYVVGKALDLEFALRGLAKATAEGTYLTAMGERAQKAYDALKGLGGMDSILSQVPADGGKVKVAAGNDAEYTKAADGIRKVAQTIESNQGGFSAALSAAAGKLPSEYHGKVYH